MSFTDAVVMGAGFGVGSGLITVLIAGVIGLGAILKSWFDHE